MKLTPWVFVPGNPLGSHSRAGFRGSLFVCACVLVFSLCLTLLYQGMRAILYLGGFVASGGPYAIAHPAPDWVWLIPVAVILMVITMMAGMAGGTKSRGPNLMALAWPAVFLALGWNFLEFGLGLPTDGRPAVGWLICALFFLPMGALPLWIILKSFFHNRKENRVGGTPFPWGSLLPQAFSAVAGIYMAIVLFRAIAR